MSQEFFRLTRLLAASFAVVSACAVLTACGGGGGGGGGGGIGDPGNPGGPTSVTVSGRITFDRLQFNASAGTGLNATPVVSPAREVLVEAVSSSSTQLASTTTDSNGNYSFSVPASTTVLIRARAQMVKTGSAPTWNFKVLDNEESDAVYALQGESASSGTSNQTRNLHAPANVGAAERPAGPFAILDTVYSAKQLILGSAPTTGFPDLNLYWSTGNRNVVNQFCPDNGIISTSFYNSDPDARDNCTANGNLLPVGIYILGNFTIGRDTDEFDAHVIAHEFGHYFEDNFSRSDSVGGDHGIGDALDLRVAFGEGWGNAFAGMTQNDPVYRDSSSGISADFGFNLETGATLNPGWFSEASVGKFLWDVFDNNTTPEAGDNVALGFTPILAVMNGAQRTTDALTSIFSFATALRSANSGSSSAIDDLLDREDINGSGAFGAGETNDGGEPGFVGVYRDITVGAPVTSICSTTAASGSSGNNKLGNRQFLRLVKNTSGLVAIRADGVPSVSVPGSGAATDPDILVIRRGVVQFAGESGDPGVELLSVQLEPGTYVLEVYAYEVIHDDPSQRVTAPRCMNLSITGTN